MLANHLRFDHFTSLSKQILVSFSTILAEVGLAALVGNPHSYGSLCFLLPVSELM